MISHKSVGHPEVTNLGWTQLGVAVLQSGCPSTPKIEELPRTWNLFKLGDFLGTPGWLVTLGVTARHFSSPPSISRPVEAYPSQGHGSEEQRSPVQVPLHHSGYHFIGQKASHVVTPTQRVIPSLTQANDKEGVPTSESYLPKSLRNPYVSICLAISRREALYKTR